MLTDVSIFTDSSDIFVRSRAWPILPQIEFLPWIGSSRMLKGHYISDKTNLLWMETWRNEMKADWCLNAAGHKSLCRQSKVLEQIQSLLEDVWNPAIHLISQVTFCTNMYKYWHRNELIYSRTECSYQEETLKIVPSCFVSSCLFVNAPSRPFATFGVSLHTRGHVFGSCCKKCLQW